MARTDGRTGATTTAKVVVVSGASAGIGLAIADRLHADGWTVVGTSRRGTSPGSWEGVVMDVDDDHSVADGMAGVVARHGRIDAVVACAGWGLAGSVEQTPISDARDQMETNFFGAVRMVQAALPVMRRLHGGRVVLVSSIGGVLGIPFQAFYSASKFALEGYGEALAYEVAPFGPDPYAVARDKAVKKMEVDERQGVPATDVARVVANVLERSRPPRRASVGKLGERVGILGKRLLPHRLFEAAAKDSLGL